MPTVNEQLSILLDKKGRADSKAIQALINKGANINTVGKLTHWSALHIAADKNDLELAKFLIDQRINPKLLSKTHHNPAFVYIHSKKMIELFSNNNCIFEGYNKHRKPFTAGFLKANETLLTAEDFLIKELKKGKKANSKLIDQILVEHDADPRTEIEGYTPLRVACEQNDIELLKTLAELEAITDQDREEFLSKTESNRVAVILIADAPTPDKYYKRLISQQIVKVEELLDIEFERKEPEDERILSLIEHYKINPNYRGGVNNKQTALHTLIHRKKPISWAYIERLLQLGANVNAINILGQRPLDFLPLSHPIAQKLLSYGARKKNEAVKTPTELLMRELDKTNKADLKVIDYFLKIGADINTHGEATGWTALHVAAAQNNDHSLKHFLSFKECSVHSLNKVQETPLAQAKSAACVKILLEFGAEIYASQPSLPVPYISCLANNLQQNQKNKELQEVFLTYELEHTAFSKINRGLVRECSEGFPGRKEKIEILLVFHKHIHEQIERLNQLPDSKLFGKPAGVEDKKRLYQQLQKDLENMAKNIHQLEGNFNNILLRTATISHHRRHRTFDKFTSFFTPSEPKEANSWIAYKKMIGTLRKGLSDSTHLRILEQSLKINDDKLACTIRNKRNELIRVRGYEEYRAYSPK